MGAKRFLAASATRIYPSSSSKSSASSEWQLNQPNHSTINNTLSRRLRLLTLARLGLTIVSIVVAVAVVACEAHALQVYNETNLDGAWGIAPLWPAGLDLRATQAILVAACLVVVTALSCLVVGVVPVVSSSFDCVILLIGLRKLGLLSFGGDREAAMRRQSANFMVII